ncbi:hypothetical protein lbkm_3441 [Lachnospiraceae bacterium KM106-2]|nr:hypothetical protein lbkm_3441 [Lachnospiraceae bacterium KM106-2]
MKKIFIGLFFILFEYTFSINKLEIGLVPDFVGYILIFMGLGELENESTYFKKLKGVVIGMVGYSSILYILTLFRLIQDKQNIWEVLLLGLIVAVAELYILYEIIMGLQELEQVKQRDFQVISLKSIWKSQAIISAIIEVIGLGLILCLGSVDNIKKIGSKFEGPIMFVTMVIIGLGIAGFVLNINFLVKFYKAKKEYEQQ